MEERDEFSMGERTFKKREWKVELRVGWLVVYRLVKWDIKVSEMIGVSTPFPPRLDQGFSVFNQLRTKP